MPHPDLSDLIRRLLAAVNIGTARINLQPIANEIALRIRRKHDRLLLRENIHLINWADAVRNAPNQIGVYSANPRFNVIQRRDIDIVFHYKIKGNTIYSTHFNLDVETIRSPQRLILENPYIALHQNNFKEGIQSWSKMKSISFTYRRHLPNTKYKGKSRFLTGIDIYAIELLLFRSAYGLMTNSNQVFFYGFFNSDIGTLPNNHRTRYVAMQCDRKIRPSKKSKGTSVEIHSYPISRTELLNDFAGNGSYYVNLIQNEIFIVP